ncbi:MAG TPA: MipA/OmpV family protein [Tahibacter sp.]|nr:MipA/OmpV family protein [Tahibacter sp.]
MMKFLWPVLLSGLSFGAVAQTAEPDDEGHDGPPRGWQLGVAAAVTDSPYAGEGTRVVPIPLVSYQGERFWFRGITAGWTVLNLGAFELAAVAKLRFDGFEVKDLGRAALARNGIDARLLDDRDKTVDVGVKMQWRGAAGELEAEILADATDKSGGQEVSIQYGYPVELGAATLTPHVGATWQSKDMANYYYGTLREEVARGVVDYKPGAATIGHVGVSFFRPLGERWSMMANLKYSVLPDEIKNSPLIEPDTDGTVSVFVGFSRAF